MFIAFLLEMNVLLEVLGAKEDALSVNNDKRLATINRRSMPFVFREFFPLY
jgi:hypothetical protein